MLRSSEEELRTKHCVEFSPPGDSEKDWALFQQLRAGSTDHYQLEKRYFRRDSSLVWGRLSISLLNARPSPLVVAMVEDITDKRTAEEGVRTSEERLSRQSIVRQSLLMCSSASAANARDFVQIPLSQVPRRKTLGPARQLGAGALVDRVLRFVHQLQLPDDAIA